MIVLRGKNIGLNFLQAVPNFELIADTHPRQQKGTRPKALGSKYASVLLGSK
jgi:hypothetical protein